MRGFNPLLARQSQAKCHCSVFETAEFLMEWEECEHGARSSKSTWLKGSRNHHQLSRSGRLVGRDASWRCRTGSACRARRTRTGSHNDGNYAAPTRSQTQHRWSGAPHADGKGQGSSQGALKGPQYEFIDLDHTTSVHFYHYTAPERPKACSRAKTETRSLKNYHDIV